MGVGAIVGQVFASAASLQEGGQGSWAQAAVRLDSCGRKNVFPAPASASGRKAVRSWHRRWPHGGAAPLRVLPSLFW